MRILLHNLQRRIHDFQCLWFLASAVLLSMVMGIPIHCVHAHPTKSARSDPLKLGLACSWRDPPSDNLRETRALQGWDLHATGIFAARLP